MDRPSKALYEALTENRSKTILYVRESILWNKVPVSLQHEIKEITAGLVQELLQKLLHAESMVQEWNRQLSREQDSTSVPER